MAEVEPEHPATVDPGKHHELRVRDESCPYPHLCDE